MRCDMLIPFFPDFLCCDKGFYNLTVCDFILILVFEFEVYYCLKQILRSMKHFSQILFSLIVILFFASLPFAKAQVNLTAIDDSIAYSGDPGLTTISITVVNTEPILSQITTIGFYFTLDFTANPLEDSLIWTMDVDVVPPGDTLEIDTVIDLCGSIDTLFPDYVSDGQEFYIGYLLDPDNIVTETNEGDNGGFFTPTLSIGCIDGIDETLISQPISLYPNPNDGHFTIEVPDDAKNFLAIAKNIITQTEVFHKTFASGGLKEIDLSSLPSGTYLLFFKWNDKFFRQLVVIEK